MDVFRLFVLIFHPLSPVFEDSFHQSLGMSCQKELGACLLEQERLFSTVRYLSLNTGGS